MDRLGKYQAELNKSEGQTENNCTHMQNIKKKPRMRIIPKDNRKDGWEVKLVRKVTSITTLVVNERTLN